MTASLRPIRHRRTFSQLRRPNGRAASGPVEVRYLYLRPAGDDQERPAVAFNVGRRAGGAVVRNRIRRRLRAALAELAPDELQPGAYLVGAGPDAATLPYPTLVGCVGDAVAGAVAVAGARTARRQ
ncbi:MAG: ribonuclease P protein component [Acidimicrobiales bacterium]